MEDRKGCSGFTIAIVAVLLIGFLSFIGFVRQRDSSSPQSSSMVTACDGRYSMSRSTFSQLRTASGSDYVDMNASFKTDLGVLIIKDRYIVPESDLCQVQISEIRKCLNDTAMEFPNDSVNSIAGLCGEAVKLSIQN